MRVTSDFLRGVGLYWRGVKTWASDPGLMAVGLVPGVLTAGLFLVEFLAMRWWLDPVSSWIADKAVGEGPTHGVVQVAAAVGLIGATLLVFIYGFVAITSVVGQPFFEHISHRVDDRLGPVARGPEWPWWRNAARGAGESLRRSLITVPLSIAIVLVGLVPVVGAPLAWSLGAFVGGWFVALEFSTIPFERRGLTLRDRRRILAKRRVVTLGFGAMAFVMSAFAPLAILMMPSAFAGGTLLARAAIDQDEQERSSAAVRPAVTPAVTPAAN